jgi:hypothetical protein
MVIARAALSILSPPQHQSQERIKQSSPKQLAGTIPQALIPPVYVKCFAAIRYSSTDPNVAIVAVILNTVPIIADSMGDRDFAGCGFFAFCFFVAIVDPVGSDPSTCPRPSSVLFSDLGRTMSRRVSEELKEDGEPKMTCDCLRISS